MAIDSCYVRKPSQCSSIAGSSQNVILCPGESIILKPPHRNASYLWEDSSGLNDLVVNTTGSYWVKIIDNGCVSNIDTFTVSFEHCDIYLVMPNLVTPNKDSKNDLFTPIKMQGIASLHTSIYNSWGDLIFATDNLNIDWDSSAVSDGLYYWVIEYKDREDNDLLQKGWVEVIK